MRILKDFKSPQFWMAVLQIGSIFFVLFVILSLILSHFRQLMAGDLWAVYQDEFANGQWVEYFFIKAVISLVYGIYMASRRRNFKKK